jgi:hypothetical protein
MTFSYSLWETLSFHLQFVSLPIKVQEEMSDEILKLKIDPFGEGCKALEDELEGLWRIHVGRIDNILYCVAYVVCEDCKDRGFEKRFGCLDCFKHHSFHIKLVSCGSRDDFYQDLGRNWQSWILTANSVDEQE